MLILMLLLLLLLLTQEPRHLAAKSFRVSMPLTNTMPSVPNFQPTNRQQDACHPASRRKDVRSSIQLILHSFPLPPCYT